jgi:hypothetical protein
MEEEKKGLKSRLDALDEKLDNLVLEEKVRKNIKKQRFKMPFRVRSQLKKLALKSKVLVILLQNNRNVKPTIAEIKDGMVILGDKVYNGCSEGIWLWNGKFPTVILPEWDLNPIMPSKLYREAVANNRLADPQTFIIRALMYKEMLQPKTIAGKTLIWVGIGAIVVLYVLFAGSK